MVSLDCGGAGHYDEIESHQGVLVESEGFSRQPLDAIAVLGQLDIAFGYGQTQTGNVRAVGSGQYYQILIRGFGGVLEDTPESARRGQTARTRKPIGRRQMVTR